MDLKAKLQYYKRTGGNREHPQEAEPKSDVPKLSASLQALMEHFNAKLLSETSVPVLKIENSFACPEVLPSFSLKRLSKGQIRREIRPSECLFFDLETTGLSGGTGTYPFLLGFGYFERNTMRIVQYFLPDFGRDYFVLKDVQTLLQQKQILVSYNGKSYDLPLLKTRVIMNRLAMDFDKLLHLDLLHLARRVWKDSLERCDLNSVEAFQLGLVRPDDIPGWQIPQAYAEFLQTGVVHGMIAAIEHNVQDIFSLAKLLVRLAEIERNPERVNDISALMRLAHLAFEMDDFPYFLAIERQFLRIDGNGHPVFLFLKSKFLKRRNEWPQALELWEQLSHERSYRFYALEELAKYYEHIVGDFNKALEYCNRALTILGKLEELHPYSTDLQLKKAFLKRQNRLLGRLS